MEIRMLKYFLTVAEEQNITQAANKLHITQPTLSRQIRDFEASLQTDLFIRKNKNCT
ncbi:LysR family transcriptional regulator [Listeria seeligeri]|uniref:LysR family transcriptional regulator n=1 Tax=Listeria seeligeri TaxID=1640 RepID=UPI0023B2195B|nr:LysR family transcriptional regulator [Listeria seeligeri]